MLTHQAAHCRDAPKIEKNNFCAAAMERHCHHHHVRTCPCHWFVNHGLMSHGGVVHRGVVHCFVVHWVMAHWMVIHHVMTHGTVVHTTMIHLKQLEILNIEKLSTENEQRTQVGYQITLTILGNWNLVTLSRNIWWLGLRFWHGRELHWHSLKLLEMSLQ